MASNIEVLKFISRDWFLAPWTKQQTMGQEISSIKEDTWVRKEKKRTIIRDKLNSTLK